jgi:hypothetical protein
MHLTYENLQEAVMDEIAATDTAFGDPAAARNAIVWTERVLGHGFDLLRLAGQRRQAAPWPSPSVSESQSTTTVNLESAPIYGHAALVTELAMIGAGSIGLRTVETYGGFGGWTAPYIAFLLSQAQHHAAVLWRPSLANSEGDAPATLVMAAATAKGQQVPPMLIAPGAAYGARERDKLLVGQVPRSLVDSLHAAARRLPEQSLLAVVAMSAERDANLVDYVSIGDAIISFNLASRAPELLDAESLLSAARAGDSVKSAAGKF